MRDCFRDDRGPAMVHMSLAVYQKRATRAHRHPCVKLEFKVRRWCVQQWDGKPRSFLPRESLRHYITTLLHYAICDMRYAVCQFFQIHMGYRTDLVIVDRDSIIITIYTSLILL